MDLKLKVESADWQGAHPGQVPTRRCGDVSLPFAAQGSGLAGRGQGGESRLAGLEEGGPGSSQICLKGQEETIDLHIMSLCQWQGSFSCLFELTLPMLTLSVYWSVSRITQKLLWIFINLIHLL